MYDAVKLPCGHRFCHYCIESYIDKEKVAKCPLCREKIGDYKLEVDKKFMKEIKELFKEEYDKRHKVMNITLEEERKMIKLKIKYGNTCKETYPGVEELTPQQQKHEYTWTAYVDIGLSRAESEKLIQSVTFKLHSTFKNPIRTVAKYPYSFTTNGWGMFDLPMIINWKPHTKLEPLKLNHYLSFEDNGAFNTYNLKIKSDFLKEPALKPAQNRLKKPSKSQIRKAFR